MSCTRLLLALVSVVICSSAGRAQFFTYPGDYSYALNSIRQVMDVSTDGKLAVTLQNDSASAHSALLRTFNPTPVKSAARRAFRGGAPVAAGQPTRGRQAHIRE